MKIEKIETTLESVKLKNSLITANQRLDKIDFVRVKVTCDNGSFTVGEAVVSNSVKKETLDSIIKSIEKVKTLLIGKELKESIYILHLQDIYASAKCAIDSAIMVLLAQSSGKTLYEYLGASTNKLVQSSVTINLNSKLKMLEDIKEAVNNNMFTLRLKVSSDISDAVDIVKSAYLNFPSTLFVVDPDQSWSKNDTLEFINRTKNISLLFIEQPVDAKDINALEEITQTTNISIMADESAYTLEDVKNIIESKSATSINIKLMKCGGVSKAVEIFEYARNNGIKLMLGSMPEGPFSINVALHLAIAYSDVIKYVDLDSPILYEELLDELEFDYNGARISYKY